VVHARSAFSRATPGRGDTRRQANYHGALWDQAQHDPQLTSLGEDCGIEV